MSDALAIDPAILDTLAFAGLDEETFRRRALESRDGLGLFEHALSFVRYRQSAMDGDKPTLVILPDAPATAESYDGFIAALGAEFNIVVMEMPGFGFSFPKSPKALEFEQSCQILVAALESLSLPRIILVGPCIQGLFAARMAEIMGDGLAGVIIGQPGDFAEQRKWIDAGLGGAILAQPFVGQIGFRMNREKVSIGFWLPFAAGPDAPLDMLKEEARKVQHAGCCYALASQVQKLREAVPETLNVAIPAEVIWGMADRSHLQTDRRTVMAYAPDAAYSEWQGIGHFIDLEAPDRLAEAARRLLATEGRGGADGGI
jgi:pimeloyl-ACP methyl ester carboxylesterase